MTSKQRSRSATGRRRAPVRGSSASPTSSPGVARGKPNPVAVAPPPVAKVASGPPRLDDDATWAAELSAAFSRLQADVRQRAHSVLGGELARMLGASGAVTAALGGSEAPAMAPEARSEPPSGRAPRAAPAPSPADEALAAEPDSAPVTTGRSARGQKAAPESPAPMTAVLRRRAGKPVTGDTALAGPVADPTPPPAAQLTLVGLAPDPEMSDGDDADAGLTDAGQDDALDAAPDGSTDDAQRDRERRRDERREARMQRRQWRQDRARQRRADARIRQAAKQTSNGPAPALALGMWSPDAPAYRSNVASSEPSAPARDASSAADADEQTQAVQAELALANDSAPLEPDEVEPAQATDGRKRIRWTRESIITELASFLVSGTVIDASFIERYGPPGLVAATRRVFGRFDAALNVAGLHVAKLYPDGPPAR